jgi:hypothetical protein
VHGPPEPQRRIGDLNPGRVAPYTTSKTANTRSSQVKLVRDAGHGVAPVRRERRRTLANETRTETRTGPLSSALSGVGNALWLPTRPPDGRDAVALGLGVLPECVGDVLKQQGNPITRPEFPHVLPELGTQLAEQLA